MNEEVDLEAVLALLYIYTCLLACLTYLLRELRPNVQSTLAVGGLLIIFCIFYMHHVPHRWSIFLKWQFVFMKVHTLHKYAGFFI